MQATPSLSPEEPLHAIGTKNPLVPPKAKENPEILDRLIGTTLHLKYLEQQAALTLHKMAAVCVAQRLELLLEAQNTWTPKQWRQALLELHHLKPHLFRETQLDTYLQSVLKHQTLSGKPAHSSLGRYTDMDHVRLSAPFLGLVQHVADTIATAKQALEAKSAPPQVQESGTSTPTAQSAPALFQEVYQDSLSSSAIPKL